VSDAGRWARMTAVFQEALERDAASRAAFLDRACVGDAALRAEVESLLASHHAAGGFATGSPMEALPASAVAALGASVTSAAPGSGGHKPQAMIGTTVSHYRIVEPLGSGGMGIVYKAIDTRLGRPAAIKMLSASVGSGMLEADHNQDRFIQEARACATLDHPNIGVVYEIGDTATGETFIAMAYYDGETLADVLKRGPLSIGSAIGIARQIAEGLAHAHRAGIIHRDIKPANIVITRDGAVKIIDFGIARLAEATRNTRTGTIVGTTAYMSPEQARGGAVDERTDLWSLGVVLYEMLTGQLPFAGETDIAVLRAVLDDAPGSVANLSEGHGKRVNRAGETLIPARKSAGGQTSRREP